MNARTGLLAAGIGMALALAPAGARAQRASYEELQTFSAVLNSIRLNYVDSVGQSALVRAAIAGALDALDPHSRYLRRATLDRLNAVRAGLLGSIGVQLDQVDGAVHVLAVGARSPAQRAGVLPGDRLVAVNDTPVAGLGDREAEAMLAGERDTKVRLALARGPQHAPLSIALTAKRANYTWPAITASLLLPDSTAYVELAEFSEHSARDLERVLDGLRKRGARRLMLDLRGNPGGLVGEAGRVAALFLPARTLFLTAEGRKLGASSKVFTEGSGDLTIPVVVLVDAHSASAAEAVAAALQDHDRALVAGRRTFGKALMQTTFPLPSGDALHLTIGRIRTPRGRLLQREYRGLSPEQYRAMAGRDAPGASAPAPVQSAAGRPLDPGPGVAPDVALPAPADLPPWWPRVLEDALDVAVADAAAPSVAGTAGEWELDPAGWDRLLVDPLVARAATALGASISLDGDVRVRIARELAARVALVRWGEDAAVHFRVSTDPDVAAALRLFERLPLRAGSP